MTAVWLASTLVVALVAPVRADVINRLPPPPPPEPANPEPEPEPEHRPSTFEGQVVRPPIRTREIVIDIPGERPLTTKIALASLAGASVVAGALGLYFHLDSRSAAGEVSASLPTGRTWTVADQEFVDRAGRSRTRAAIAYGVGGGFAIAAIVGYIVSHPTSEQNVIRPHRAAIVPTSDGAVVTGAWTW